MEKTNHGRYVVSDELGPLRTFWTKKEALRWIQSRDDCTLLETPKSKPPSIWEDFEPAVF
jgi:hypothetical protein